MAKSPRNESKTNLINQHYFDMEKYEVNERHKSITPCPYGMLDFDDKVKMVGSEGCLGCLYCFDIDKKKHLVLCATRTSTTYNIKEY